MCSVNIKIQCFCVLVLETRDFQQWYTRESLFLFFSKFGFVFKAMQDF